MFHGQYLRDGADMKRGDVPIQLMTLV